MYDVLMLLDAFQVSIHTPAASFQLLVTLHRPVFTLAIGDRCLQVIHACNPNIIGIDDVFVRDIMLLHSVTNSVFLQAIPD